MVSEPAKIKAMPINERHVGGTFDDFLKEQGIYDEVMQRVAKRRSVLQSQKIKKAKRKTKTVLPK